VREGERQGHAQSLVARMALARGLDGDEGLVPGPVEPLRARSLERTAHVLGHGHGLRDLGHDLAHATGEIAEQLTHGPRRPRRIALVLRHQWITVGVSKSSNS
jgi:hypothetical protein